MAKEGYFVLGPDVAQKEHTSWNLIVINYDSAAEAESLPVCIYLRIARSVIYLGTHRHYVRMHRTKRRAP